MNWDERIVKTSLWEDRCTWCGRVLDEHEGIALKMPQRGGIIGSGGHVRLCSADEACRYEASEERKYGRKYREGKT